jgi:hypothetical protein
LIFIGQDRPHALNLGNKAVCSGISKMDSCTAGYFSFRRRECPNTPNLLLSKFLDEANGMSIPLIERVSLTHSPGRVIGFTSFRLGFWETKKARPNE